MQSIGDRLLSSSKDKKLLHSNFLISEQQKFWFFKFIFLFPRAMCYVMNKYFNDCSALSEQLKLVFSKLERFFIETIYKIACQIKFYKKIWMRLCTWHSNITAVTKWIASVTVRTCTSIITLGVAPVNLLPSVTLE